MRAFGATNTHVAFGVKDQILYLCHGSGSTSISLHLTTMVSISEIGIHFCSCISHHMNHGLRLTSVRLCLITVRILMSRH